MLDLRPAVAAGAWYLAGPSRRALILLVEDDEAIAMMYSLQLSAAGYAVEIAPDAATGIAHLRRRRPDLVLLDIRLPRREGFAVLEQMRHEPDAADIPVLVLSNYGEQEYVRRASELGAREYLIKSQTTPPDLLERVRRYLPGLD
jgi:DNA-binding response OmpR family regulator